MHQGADTRSKRNYDPAGCGKRPHNKLDKMKLQRKMLQMKEQDKNPQVQLKEEETVNLPENEFRVNIRKMIQNLRKGMESQIEKTQDIFNTDLEKLKNKPTVMNNTITKTKKYSRRNQ